MENPETPAAPKAERLAFNYDIANDQLNVAFRLNTGNGGNVHVTLLKVGEDLSVAELKGLVRAALTDVHDAI